MFFSVMAFNYHVTGSWWPTARMDADGQGVTSSDIGFASTSSDTGSIDG